MNRRRVQHESNSQEDHKSFIQKPINTLEDKRISASPSDCILSSQKPEGLLISRNFKNCSELNLSSSDDKYSKISTHWYLRSLTSHLQRSSENALRTFVQQPLSTAAALVTGNRIIESNKSIPDQSVLSSHHKREVIILDEESIMAARDRTTEFTNAIRSFQSRNIARPHNNTRKAKYLQSYSEFMDVAKYVGKNIASTYAKLEKLTVLAQKKGLFDFRSKEIQELTYIIKGDLTTLNHQISRLQEIYGNQRRNKNGRHLMSHSSNMVLALQSKLASMSNQFKYILEVRTENLKHQKSRQDHFIQEAIAVNSQSTSKQSSLLLSDQIQDVSIDMSTADFSPLARQHVQQQIPMNDEFENYLQQRAETMQNIESTIVELGGIFQQLAHMVKEQEETVERIDTNVQDVELNIVAAHGEILKHFQSVAKNRWLMIKIFGVLIFFFIFFVISMI